MDKIKHERQIESQIDIMTTLSARSLHDTVRSFPESALPLLIAYNVAEESDDRPHHSETVTANEGSRT